MIIDFHTHFVPEALARRNPGAGEGITTIFVDGVPAQSFHRGLYDMGQRIEIMDASGMDLAVLSSGAGLEGDLEKCRIVNGTKHMDAYDLARSVGREFALAEATIRLINSGMMDDFPSVTICMSHLGGGISALLGRVRGYQDKVFWGTANSERHGKLPRRGEASNLQW